MAFGLKVNAKIASCLTIVLSDCHLNRRSSWIIQYKTRQSCITCWMDQTNSWHLTTIGVLHRSRLG